MPVLHLLSWMPSWTYPRIQAPTLRQMCIVLRLISEKSWDNWNHFRRVGNFPLGASTSSNWKNITWLSKQFKEHHVIIAAMIIWSYLSMPTENDQMPFFTPQLILIRTSHPRGLELDPQTRGELLGNSEKLRAGWCAYPHMLLEISREMIYWHKPILP